METTFYILRKNGTRTLVGKLVDAGIFCTECGFGTKKHSEDILHNRGETLEACPGCGVPFKETVSIVVSCPCCETKIETKAENLTCPCCTTHFEVRIDRRMVAAHAFIWAGLGKKWMIEGNVNRVENSVCESYEEYLQMVTEEGKILSTSAFRTLLEDMNTFYEFFAAP